MLKRIKVWWLHRRLRDAIHHLGAIQNEFDEIAYQAEELDLTDTDWTNSIAEYYASRLDYLTFTY